MLAVLCQSRVASVVSCSGHGVSASPFRGVGKGPSGTTRAMALASAQHDSGVGVEGERKGTGCPVSFTRG